MTVQDLKNAILQLAVQGNLVEQRSEEGSAEGLFKEILQEKITGLCKKEPSIADEEIPFDIPETWKWVRINNIAVLYNGRAYSKEELKEDGKYPVLRVGNLFTNRQWYYSDMELEEDKYCHAGDLLYAWSASFGPHIWDGCKVIYHYHIWKIVHSSRVFKKYLYYYLLADTERIKQSGHGLAMIHVTKTGTEQRLIPLPPFAEQQRIVAKIEKLLPLVEEYGKAEEQLTALNAEFPDKLRKSILQQAIQGKLTERDPADEPASELLKRIRTEKERLIKEGKIKKEKPLPPITEEEMPFEIPDNWEWVRFYDTVDIASNLVDPGKYQNYMHIAPDNIEKGTGVLLACRTVKEDAVASPNHLFYTGQLIYSKIRPLLRKAVIAPFDGLCSADMYPINTWTHPRYLQLIMLSDFFNLQVAGIIANRVKMPKINQDELRQTIFPLPPLAEQQRIVDRVNELLAVCDELK